MKKFFKFLALLLGGLVLVAGAVIGTSYGIYTWMPELEADKATGSIVAVAILTAAIYLAAVWGKPAGKKGRKPLNGGERQEPTVERKEDAPKVEPAEEPAAAQPKAEKPAKAELPCRQFNRRYMAAALAVLVLIIGAVVYFGQKPKQPAQPEQQAQQLEPLKPQQLQPLVPTPPPPAPPPEVAEVPEPPQAEPVPEATPLPQGSIADSLRLEELAAVNAAAQKRMQAEAEAALKQKLEEEHLDQLAQQALEGSPQNTSLPTAEEEAELQQQLEEAAAKAVEPEDPAAFVVVTKVPLAPQEKPQQVQKAPLPQAKPAAPPKPVTPKVVAKAPPAKPVPSKPTLLVPPVAQGKLPQSLNGSTHLSLGRMPYELVVGYTTNGEPVYAGVQLVEVQDGVLQAERLYQCGPDLLTQQRTVGFDAKGTLTLPDGRKVSITAYEVLLTECLQPGSDVPRIPAGQNGQLEVLQLPTAN